MCLFVNYYYQFCFVVYVCNIVWVNGGLVIVSEGIWCFQEYQWFFWWFKFQFVGVVGVVQVEGKQCVVWVWLCWEVFVCGYFMFVYYWIFQWWEIFCENMYVIVWLYFYVCLWCVEQNGIVWIQYGKFVQGIQ